MCQELEEYLHKEIHQWRMAHGTGIAMFLPES